MFLRLPLQLRHIAEDRVPFPVKGGGHATNPGFSSTPGVHISMTRFNDIVIRKDNHTVEIGAELTWTMYILILSLKASMLSEVA